MAGNASIHCVHCSGRTDYEPAALHLSLFEGGYDDVTMVLRFHCPKCGQWNSQLIVEKFALALTDIGVPTTVMGPIPELEENVELRAGNGPQGRLSIGFVETFATMSIDSFNRLVARHAAEGMGHG